SALPTPAATPPLTQVPWDPSQAGARMIAFASTRFQGSVGAFDVYLFDPATATVYAIPAANTFADEVHPRLSSNGRWLVFATNFRGNFDLVRYDLQEQIVDPLVTLNTLDNEVSPSIDDSGTTLAYLAAVGGVTQIRVFDLLTGVAAVPAPIAALQALPHSPQISGDGHWLAFSATDVRGADVYLYKLGDTAVSSPPFVNSPADDVDPWLSQDGQRLLFASNRRGSFDLYEADLVSGFTNDLVLASSPGNDREPRYMGLDGKDVLFQSDRSVYEDRIMLFHPGTGIVDTLPLLHEIGEDDILGNGYTVPPTVDGPAPVDDGFFGFGDLHRKGPIFGRRGF
ncbi:MAG: serine/threonine protein kinase, partial [Cyanobacteria bacterium RYN_339]|nr:serine/threonine protein kinase [Cyanobacteria bacterium RYN_339]